MNIKIIGDSHVRAFRDIKYIYPIFIGQGKNINLFSKNIDTVIERAVEVDKNFEGDIIYLSLGEPNCRYGLGYGWYPHNHNNVDSKFDINNIKDCVKNYESILYEIERRTKKRVFALTVSTCYEPSISSIKYMNSLILDTFKNKCLDLTQYYEDINYYNADVIHLNTNYSEILLNKMVELDHIKDKSIYKREKHIYENFGCIRPWI
jgi:hypothetical protein